MQKQIDYEKLNYLNVFSGINQEDQQYFCHLMWQLFSFHNLCFI
jgi:hypothetical protein